MTVLLVFAGGAVGAPARYLLDRWVQARHGRRFPIGTLAVNVLGCFILGWVSASAGLGSWTAAAVGTGFCGGFTTYSTFTVEAVELASQGRTHGAAAAGMCAAGLYVALSMLLGLCAVAAGSAL